MSSDTTTIEHVEVSIDRLKELEKLEAALPRMIEDALKDYKQAALKRLHEKDKANPEAVNLRARRYAQKNRELLNAKRREKRRLEKLAKEEKEKHEEKERRVTMESRGEQPVNIALSIQHVRESHALCIDSNDGTIVRFD
jgi:alpha-galactosidase/6-phospho-beta-glucosidase family protein